jgi:GTP cyclohydrolase I
MSDKIQQELMQLYRRQLELLGEDPGREGLGRTPWRAAEAMRFLTQGYEQDPKRVLNDALFEAGSDEMIVGLSKLPRLVDVFARRLQIQERLTSEIATSLQGLIGAEGVGVVVEAQHLCMIMRGVQKQNSYAITSALLGRFREDQRTRAEFLDLIRHRRNGS